MYFQERGRKLCYKFGTNTAKFQKICETDTVLTWPIGTGRNTRHPRQQWFSKLPLTPILSLQTPPPPNSDSVSAKLAMMLVGAIVFINICIIGCVGFCLKKKHDNPTPGFEMYCGIISFLVGCCAPGGCLVCFCPIDEREIEGYGQQQGVEMGGVKQQYGQFNQYNKQPGGQRNPIQLQQGYPPQGQPQLGYPQQGQPQQGYPPQGQLAEAVFVQQVQPQKESLKSKAAKGAAKGLARHAFDAVLG